MKIKKWFYQKFLPAWCRDDLIDKNARLQIKIAELKQENTRLNAYIDGLEIGIERRVTVNVNGVRQ